MSLLTIVQDVCGQLSLVSPATVVGNSDRQVGQMLSLVNKAGRELARDHKWEALKEEFTFVTTATPAQAAALPSDFDRFIEDSFYNRSTMRPVAGPITSQQWQALQAIPALNTVYLMYRQRQGQFLIAPTPPVGQTIAYEYISNAWVKPAVGNATASFQNDNDVALLDESLIEDSLIWRFLRAKGLDYAEEMATFERNKQLAMGKDGGAGSLSLSPRPINLGRINLPDGNWPGD